MGLKEIADALDKATASEKTRAVKVIVAATDKAKYDASHAEAAAATQAAVDDFKAVKAAVDDYTPNTDDAP